MSELKEIVITGAAGGLGGAMVKYVVERGYKVYALDYVLNDLEKHPLIVPIKVDVTSDDSVKAAVDIVKQHTSRIEAIINFAGILRMGSVIELPACEMLNILNINLVGTYRINQAFFEMLTKGTGRIINISSETGVLSPAPFSGFYYTSKRAIEMYSDALRRELKFLGIKVIKIRPGAFQTDMQGHVPQIMDKAIQNSTYFKKQLKKGDELAKGGTQHAKKPEVLAQVIFKALTDKRPKIVYSSNLNWQLKFVSALPEKLQDYIYYKVLK